MGTSTIAPGFLVAGPSLKCPFFHRAVVLLAEHNDEGSLGFVINKPADYRIEEVVEELGLPAWNAPELPVMMGGPVTPDTGWILFEDREGTVGESIRGVSIDEHIAFSSSVELLSLISGGAGPSRCTMMLGYSGWSMGQLEKEMRDGSWIPVDLDYGLIFDTPVEDRWRLALATLGIDPARFVDQHIANA